MPINVPLNAPLCPCMSMVVHVCLFLPLYVFVCLCVSLHAPLCLCMHLYCTASPFMLLHVLVLHRISLYAPMFLCLPLCVSVCPFSPLYSSECQCIPLYAHGCPCIPLCVQKWPVISNDSLDHEQSILISWWYCWSSSSSSCLLLTGRGYKLFLIFWFRDFFHPFLSFSRAGSVWVLVAVHLVALSAPQIVCLVAQRSVS